MNKDEKGATGLEPASTSEAGIPPPQSGNARVHGRPRMRGTDNSCDDTCEELNLRDTPSPINFTPWNNITLTFSGTNYSTIEVWLLFVQLRKQLDPNRHFLGTVEKGDFDSGDQNFDQIPMDLATAHSMIETDPAMQMRIRQIKIWAEETTRLYIKILKPHEDTAKPQEVLLFKEKLGSVKEVKTFGCKLPQDHRNYVYYSLDYKANRAPVLQYSTDRHSKVNVQFNIEWKSMACTRNEFAEKVHYRRFSTELLERVKLPPLEEIVAKALETVRSGRSRLRDALLSQDDDFSPEEEEVPSPVEPVITSPSIDALPPKTLREWKNDPFLQRYLGVLSAKRKQVDDSEAGPSSTQRPKTPTPETEDDKTAHIPENLKRRLHRTKSYSDRLETEEVRFIEETIETLQLLTAKLSDSSSKSGKSQKSDN